MAKYYGYFNGLDYDESFPMLRVKSLIPNGVYDGELRVVSGTGMMVSIVPGRAWINGYFYYTDGQDTITVATASATQPRKDIIVLRLDKAAKKMSVEYVQGTAESNPSAPLPNITDALYELQLARVDVPAGLANITQANITDTRPDKTLCGITAGFQGLDVETLTEQAQAKFDEWFSNLQNQLDTNQAGNLQNQINGKQSQTAARNAMVKADANGILVAASDGLDYGIRTAVLYDTGTGMAQNGFDYGLSQSVDNFKYILFIGLNNAYQNFYTTLLLPSNLIGRNDGYLSRFWTDPSNQLLFYVTNNGQNMHTFSGFTTDAKIVKIIGFK